MILVVLPQNNPLSQSPKPVVSAMIPYVKFSKFQDSITVISPYSESPNQNLNHIIFEKNIAKKKLYQNAVIKHLSAIQNNSNIQAIEVHQDVKLAGNIAKKFPYIKVSVVKHGDYCFNRLKEKIFLFKCYFYHRYIKHLHAIYCNSEYVATKISQCYPQVQSRISVAYNTYGHIYYEVINSQNINTNKKNQIIFAGKPVYHKGIVEFINALPAVLNQHNNWNAIIVGAFFSKKYKYSEQLDKLINQPKIKALIDSKKLMIYKNLVPSAVFQKMQESKICVVPTKTNEPFGLVCLEAHLAQCAVISSKKGGLPEISENFAIYLQSVSEESIAQSLNTLIYDEDKLKSIAKGGYHKAKEKFDPIKVVASFDKKRTS